MAGADVDRRGHARLQGDVHELGIRMRFGALGVDAHLCAIVAAGWAAKVDAINCSSTWACTVTDTDSGNSTLKPKQQSRHRRELRRFMAVSDGRRWSFRGGTPTAPAKRRNTLMYRPARTLHLNMCRPTCVDLGGAIGLP